MDYDLCEKQVASADKVLVVGTSLAVYPAAGLLNYTSTTSEKFLVTLDVEHPSAQFTWLRGNAAAVVPQLAAEWLKA